MFKTLGLLAALLTLCGAVARAQVVYNQAATAGESYARGISDVVQSAGQANLLNSQAANNYADARSKELDNRLKYTNTYFQNRQMNEKYRAQLDGKPMSSEDAVRIASAAAPKRLSSAQLDPITGQIKWPMGLRDPRYTTTLVELDKMYNERAAQGYIDAPTFSKITQTCNDLKTALDKNVDSMDSNMFLEARKFIESLSYEARFPAG